MESPDAILSLVCFIGAVLLFLVLALKPTGMHALPDTDDPAEPTWPKEWRESFDRWRNENKGG